MGHVTQKHRSHISSKRAKYPFGKFRKVSKLELKEWHDRFKTMEEDMKKEYNVEEDIKETVDKLTRLVNNFDIPATKFAEELCNKTHPTLQQNVMKLFIACIKMWSEKYKKGHYDLRSEATCKMSKEIMDKLGDNIYLPMI